MAADYAREFHSIIAVVQQVGQAQLEDLMQDGKKKKPKDGFWRVEPESPSEHHPRTSLQFFTEDGRTFRHQIPKTCNAATVRILTESLRRYKFDLEEKKRFLADRSRDLARRNQAALVVKERERQVEIAANKPVAAQQVPKKMKKVYPTPKVEEGDISATYAQALLDCPGDGSIIPRPLSPSNLSRFDGIIDAGLWVPDYMYVDWFGFVVNGRHRLTVISRKDHPVFCRFIYGVDPVLFAVCDSAKTRSGADTIHSAGLAPENPVENKYYAAGLRLLHEYKSGTPWGSWSKHRLETIVYVELARRYPEVIEALERAKVLYNAGKRTGTVNYSPSASIVFCYLAIERLPEGGDLLDRFMLAVTRGENLGGKDPRKALYDLMRDRQSKRRGPDSAISRVKQLALLLKMWNLWCSGRSVDHATWRDGEQMPLAITESEVTIRP